MSADCGMWDCLSVYATAERSMRRKVDVDLCESVGTPQTLYRYA